jgi:hypothetical protein
MSEKYTGQIRKPRLKMNLFIAMLPVFRSSFQSCPPMSKPLSTKNKSTPLHPKRMNGSLLRK